MDTQEILDNADSISLEAAEATTFGKNEFCELWPQVKKGLQLLQDLIKNPVVKLSIGGIIAAGDVVFGKICH